MGNGPTEDEAGIMDHDHLSQHSEEGEEVSAHVSTGQHTDDDDALCCGMGTFKQHIHSMSG